MRSAPQFITAYRGFMIARLYLRGRNIGSLINYGPCVSGENAPAKMEDDANQMTILATNVIAHRDSL